MPPPHSSSALKWSEGLPPSSAELQALRGRGRVCSSPCALGARPEPTVDFQFIIEYLMLHFQKLENGQQVTAALSLWYYKDEEMACPRLQRLV